MTGREAAKEERKKALPSDESGRARCPLHASKLMGDGMRSGYELG